MALDPTTEAIAHFVGLFEIALEELRLRDEYDKFRGLQAQAEPLADLPNIDTEFKAPYRLEDYDPSLRFVPEAPALPPAAPEMGTAPSGFEPPAVGATFVETDASAGGAGSGLTGPTTPAAPPPLILPPPNSIATVTLQQAHLSDNDSFGSLAAADFAAPGIYLSQLTALADIAATLDPLAGTALPAGQIVTGQDAVAFAASLAGAPSSAAVADAQQAMARGADAQGVIVDGAPAADLPLWADLRPAFFAPEEKEEDGDTPPDPFRDTPLAGDGVADEHDLDPGHESVAGANRAINEAHVHTHWVDAPVIAVAGDAVQIDAVSQVNVLVDRDHAVGSATFDGEGSTAVNAAEITTTSAPGPAAAAADAGIFPDSWRVSRLDHDLTLTNEVRQVTFATDTDRAEVSFTASSTRLGFGENLITNIASFQEFGFGYDLIFVGGDMIDIDVVRQTNVLLDNDSVGTAGATPVSVSGGDNTLLNQASLLETGRQSFTEITETFADAIEALRAGAETIGQEIARDIRFEGAKELAVLYVGGNFTSSNIIDQTNVIGDADQIMLQAEAFARDAGDAFTLTAGSNGLLNTAAIREQGIDSEVMVGGETYSDALLHQANLIDTDAAPTGVGMAALATEAVAFLADDMIGPEPSAVSDAGAVAEHDGAIPLDVMQTMLG